LRIDFSAYRPSVSGTYPIEISAYLRWEAEGDQANTNYNCDGTEYANFYIQVYNHNTGQWVNLYSSTGTGIRGAEGWYNISITSQDYVSTTGEVWYRIVVDAYDCHGREEEREAMCGSTARAELYVDYVEFRQNVPDTEIQSVCVQYISDNFPEIWGDLYHNETVILNVLATSGGSPVQNFPVKLYAIDEWGNEQFVGIGITGSGGITPFVRITGGEGYRMNFSRIEAMDEWIINNQAYVKNTSCGSQTLTPPPDRGRNLVIAPTSYVLELIGRVYYPGGIDWGRFVWYIDDSSVQKHRNIPLSQKFINKSASFTFLKYGFDYRCTDNTDPCDKEGIFATSSGPVWPACITIGERDTLKTPFCDRTPTGYSKMRATLSVHIISLIRITLNIGGIIESGNCYVDTDPYGNPVGLHRCGLFSGYRVGPLIQMGIPDNALGYSAWLAIDSYGGSLSSFMSGTTYNQHEGPGQLHLTQHTLNICGMTSTQQETDIPHTEYAYKYEVGVPVSAESGIFTATGTSYVQPDIKGGLGMINFIGLYGDQKHVVGLIVGHRFGIHPFIAIVQTVPEYPATREGWNNYEERWLYYLFENLKFIAKTWGREMSVWNYRYSNATNQANLVRAFEDLIVDITPRLRVTFNLMTSAPQTLVYPFAVTTFLLQGDFGYLQKIIYGNQTILDKAMEAAMALMEGLPGILGPAPPACHPDPDWTDPDTYQCYGLNFIWAGSELLSYEERELFAYRLMELLNAIIDSNIQLMKAIPKLEDPSSIPRWNFNWIHPE